MGDSNGAGALERLQTKVYTALENLVTLRVTTVVGKVAVEVKDSGGDPLSVRVTGVDNATTECATTAINMVDGDVTEIRSEKFAAGGELAKLHDDAVANATKIMQGNIETLKQALTSLKGVLFD